MRLRLEKYLHRVWYQKDPPPWLLRQLSRLYWNRFQARHKARVQRGVSKPLIVVGNITVGGSGKTPVVMAITEALLQRGWRVGVVARGYLRKSAGVCRLGPDTTPEAAGDEAWLIHRRYGIPTAVGTDRVAACEAIAGEVDVIIADDGLQHFALQPDLRICVINGRYGFGNGRLLPAGPLREPLERLAAMDYILVNLDQGIAMPAGVPPSAVAYSISQGDLRRLDDENSTMPLSGLQGESVHGVAGIAHPDLLFHSLQAGGLKLIPHAFPDHHPFRRSDFAFDDGKTVIMTEKDAVKCRKLNLPNAWYLPIKAELPQAFRQQLCAAVEQLINARSQ